MKRLFITWIWLVSAASALGAEAGEPLDISSLNHWHHKDGSPAKWLAVEDYFEVVPGSGDLISNAEFSDFKMHVEFWLPLELEKHGQDRANSGLYLLGLYELQILDSIDNPTFENGVCGSLYKQKAPLAAASLPAEQWQSYDIDFVAPRVDAAGKVLKAGSLTVLHNGILIHSQTAFDRPTGSAGRERQFGYGPLRLQDHGSRVRFRNLIVTRSSTSY